MDYFFRLMHPLVAAVCALFLVCAAYWRWFYYKSAYMSYSLVTAIKKSGITAAHWHKTIPFMLRTLLLLILLLLAARAQRVYNQSVINAHGIDIMMVLDVSGSMQCFDDMKDKRTRFEVAKAEGINFIEKRTSDQIGLVMFGKDAVSRCPLTLDKIMLKDLLSSIQLGDIDPDGTVLSIAISMAARRLQSSKASSKVMIVLTDGEPTPGLDVQPAVAINLAKKLGIKIYTIGVGGEHGGLWYDPMFGIRQMGFRLNKELLQQIATQTGGKFFLAQRPEDINAIYTTIDELEKTEYQAPIFTHYHDLVIPLVCVAFILFFVELCATTFVWFKL